MDCAEASSRELLNCNFTTPRAYDPYLVVHKLYGPWFEPANPGAGSLLVLGQHNSGTSMLARLIMLMGAFQGNVKGMLRLSITARCPLLHVRFLHMPGGCAAGLSTSHTNRLKYWEKIDVTHFHDMVLSWVTDPNFKPYHAQGVDMNQLSDGNRDNLKCFAKKVIKDLDRHKPWVLKDPRMLLFADFWIKEVLFPLPTLCVQACCAWRCMPKTATAPGAQEHAEQEHNSSSVCMCLGKPPPSVGSRDMCNVHRNTQRMLY